MFVFLMFVLNPSGMFEEQQIRRARVFHVWSCLGLCLGLLVSWSLGLLVLCLLSCFSLPLGLGFSIGLGLRLSPIFSLVLALALVWSSPGLSSSYFGHFGSVWFPIYF